MAAAKQQPAHKIPFDEAKFATMVEPFTVRVEKLRGNARTPIVLPPSEDPNLSPGEGWARENVRNMENWLVTEWTGGGLYEISITDSSAQPMTMKWSPFWDPREYKELVPPPMRDVMTPIPHVVPIQLHQNQQPQVRPMSAFPNGLPGGYQHPYVQQQQAPQQPYYQQAPYPMPAPPPVGTQSWPQWQAEAEKREREAELRQLRDERNQRDREALEAKHRMEIERERTKNEDRFSRQDQGMNELRTMIASLTQTLTQAQSKPSNEIEMMQRKLDEERREREAEKRDAATREMIKTLNENAQRQIDAMMRQMEVQAQAARDASTNRHDPLVAMMQEQNRLNTEALKEMSRNSLSSMQQLQGFMLTPSAMIDLATRQSQGADQMADKLTRTFTNVIDLQQKVTENALQMQPGGSGVIDVVRDGVQGVKEMVERYAGVKTAEQRIAANAQVAIAQAQASAIMAQAGVVHTPPAPQPQPQLAGVPTNGVSTNGVSNGAPTTAPTNPRGVERFGRFDDEWFGPLMSEVNELRKGAARFIESLKKNPPRTNKDGEIDGTSPEQAAMATMQAVQMVMQHQPPIMIGAMTDLLFADRFADFFAVLLPDVPATYRDDTTEIFIAAAKRVQGLADDEEVPGEHDDDGDDGDDGDDDGDDGSDDGEVDAKPTPINRPAPVAPVVRRRV